MATENVTLAEARVAAADLSAKQYFAVNLDANGKIALSNAAADTVGVLQDNPKAGRVGTIALAGKSKAVYGGNVAAGESLNVDANGKWVAAAAGERAFAIALVAGVAGDIGTVLLGRHAVPV